MALVVEAGGGSADSRFLWLQLTNVDKLLRLAVSTKFLSLSLSHIRTHHLLVLHSSSLTVALAVFPRQNLLLPPPNLLKHHSFPRHLSRPHRASFAPPPPPAHNRGTPPLWAPQQQQVTLPCAPPTNSLSASTFPLQSISLLYSLRQLYEYEWYVVTVYP